MNGWYETLFVNPWPWWAGGLVIGLLVPLLYYFENVSLGVSTGYGSIIKAIFPGTRLKWFHSSTFADRWGWRVFFLGGMVLGAFISARLGGRPLFTGEMGLFTANVDWSLPLTALFFAVGGFFLGLGARIAGGCTSGHSIHGLATLQPSSLVATIGFLATGIISTYFVRVFLMGGLS